MWGVEGEGGCSVSGGATEGDGAGLVAVVGVGADNINPVVVPVVGVLVGDVQLAVFAEAEADVYFVGAVGEFVVPGRAVNPFG